MANYRGARNEILLICMKAAIPPEKREMVDQMLVAVAEVNPRAHFPPKEYGGRRRGPVPGLGTSSGAFTHEINPTVKGKAASETSQTLKSKGKYCSQSEDSDDDVVIIEPPVKHASNKSQRMRNRRSR
ncbi:hypothetical protein PIB30_067936 [Stylosanthes scabra]|uniref:Uncharacterized protein n=1 Tax=Stylosanthes scabra TaxID=79078 RepID=A0ABU6ULI6_9FABA|nr:hypothetical protein [Stylosanthes scabra]